MNDSKTSKLKFRRVLRRGSVSGELLGRGRPHSLATKEFAIIAHECVSPNETGLCERVSDELYFDDSQFITICRCLRHTHTHSCCCCCSVGDNRGASVSHDVSSDAVHNDCCRTLRRISMRLHHHLCLMRCSTRPHHSKLSV